MSLLNNDNNSWKDNTPNIPKISSVMDLSETNSILLNPNDEPDDTTNHLFKPPTQVEETPKVPTTTSTKTTPIASSSSSFTTLPSVKISPLPLPLPTSMMTMSSITPTLGLPLTPSSSTTITAQLLASSPAVAANKVVTIENRCTMNGNESPVPDSAAKVLPPIAEGGDGNEKRMNFFTPPIKFSVCMNDVFSGGMEFQPVSLKRFLSKYFHLPIVDASKELGMCTTMLKKLCRRCGITRWPYRKVYLYHLFILFLYYNGYFYNIRFIFY